MTIELKRTDYSDKQVIGTMTIGALTFHTLELAWKNNEKRVSCIPSGTYEVVKRWSEKYGDHFHLLNVPNRDYILIHHGNYHTDILGCILVGKGLADINNDGYKDVTASKQAMKELNNILPQRFNIKIQ